MNHTAMRRRLRQDSTPAERVLWQHLRSRRVGGLKFRRQHSLHPYIVDFYCPAARLVVELDGGHHSEPHHLEYDRKRSLAFAQWGVSVLRFSNRQVITDTNAVLSVISDHVARLTLALFT